MRAALFAVALGLTGDELIIEGEPPLERADRASCYSVHQLRG